jgi:hypothetical protein
MSALAEALVELAVRLLPPEDRERWRDEWLAELDAERASVAATLRFSLGVCRGAGAMAAELRGRHALDLAASSARADSTRRTVAARPPYYAGVEFWS